MASACVISSLLTISVAMLPQATVALQPSVQKVLPTILPSFTFSHIFIVSPQGPVIEAKPSALLILSVFLGFMAWSMTISVYAFFITSFSSSSNLSVISSPLFVLSLFCLNRQGFDKVLAEAVEYF